MRTSFTATSVEVPKEKTIAYLRSVRETVPGSGTGDSQVLGDYYFAIADDLNCEKAWRIVDTKGAFHLHFAVPRGVSHPLADLASVVSCDTSQESETESA